MRLKGKVAIVTSKLGVRSCRAVAQIILASIIRSIYKNGKFRFVE